MLVVMKDGTPAGRAACKLVQVQAGCAGTVQLTLQFPHGAEEMCALTYEGGT